MKNEELLEITKDFWNSTADDWFGVTALPTYGTQFVTEDELHLFGDVTGKKMLEIGCGSGHSLKYHANRGAGELWGLDMSQKQLENADKYLSSFNLRPRLICSPMEADCVIPKEYFDVVYSIYAIGWATDLDLVLNRIFSYLKKGGEFIFSWRHPLNNCVTSKDGLLIFEKSYFDEEWQPITAFGKDVLLSSRKISTYINALVGAGFIIEKMIEQTDAETMSLIGEMSDRSRKAQKLPLSFIFKAKKPL